MLAPAVPELFEDEFLAAVESRTEQLQSLRELGPPDLVHLTRQNKNSQKQVGIFHHVTGVDASSPASLAAYVNTLVSGPGDKNGKITAGIYCCYNAFSRLDMRVRILIPGSVESYCVDERGEKRVTSEALWLETYLCSVLRAYAYADDGSGDSMKKIVGCRRFNPITSTDAEHRFFEAAEKLFFNGWQLGSEPEIQVPNLVSNHLTNGLIRYITTTGRYVSGINLFEKLRLKDTEIASLLTQVYVAADEEVKAVRLLNESIKALSMDYALLNAQSDFLRLKGRSDLALEISKRSVISAPSEFVTWSRLAQIYIDLEQFDLALLTLNSCPMFTYQDKDIPPAPPADKIVLPMMPETQFDEISDYVAPNLELVPPHLRKLVAGSFKGTFEKAYDLLTEITKRIGWDDLLIIRSKVFVMEEEYRHDKQGPNGKSSNGPAQKSTPNGGTPASDEPHLERPSQTVASEAVRAGSDNAEPSTPADPSHTAYTSFRHKRLCERWLDNLFMVLYEDLRAYTVWRASVAEAAEKEDSSAWTKSAEEWEILADLAHRLHYSKEELEAWQQCLGIRFSPKAMNGVLRACQRQGNVKDIVNCLIRLICWQWRWYSEFSPELLKTIRKLIEDEGALKIDSIMRATGLPAQVLGLTHSYAETCATFRSSGSDA